jgi:hypothetical protein
MATITLAQQNAVSGLYIALFNRAPDALGFKFWTDGLANGASLTTLINAFLGSPEARSIYTTTQTQEQFVAAFYQTVFGRSADAGGLAFWTGVLNTASASNPETARAVLVSKLIELVSTPLPVKPADLSDAQYSQTVADRDLFGKKVVVGLGYAVDQQGNDLTAAKQLIANLTAPTTPGSSAPVGQTFVLSTLADNLVGGAGDDTFDARLVGGLQTLQTADTLDGGAGTDTLILTLNSSQNGSGNFAPALSNIEVIRVTAHNGADTKLNLSGSTGVTQVGFDGSTIEHAIINVGNAALSVRNQTQNATFEGSTATALSLTLSKVGTSATSITVDLAGAGDTVGARATTQNIVATDAYVNLRYSKSSVPVTSVTVAAAGDNKLQLAGADAGTVSSLTVTGSGSVDFMGQSLSALTQFTAGDGGIKLTSSNATAGALTITSGAGADTISADGASIASLNTGGGNDIVVLASGVLGSAAKVALGAGDDWLVIGAIPSVGASIDGGDGRDALFVLDASFDYTAINTVTHFEVLAINSAGRSVDVAQVTAMTEFMVVNNGTTSFTNATNASKFEVLLAEPTVATVNIANAGGQSQTDVTLNNRNATNTDLTLGTLSLTGITTMSLTSTKTGSTTGGNVITTLNNSDNSTITVKGSTDLTFTLATGTAVGSKVDASTFTGKLNVTGSGFSDVIIVNGAVSTDTLTGGAGADSFVFSTPDLASTAGTVTAIITDFLPATDKIQVSGGVAASGTTLMRGGTSADLATLLTAADTALDGTVKYYLGQIGTTAYLVTDGDGIGYTNVIQLTGVTLAAFQDTDLIAA